MSIRRAKSSDKPALLRLARAFATSFAVEQAAFERSFDELLTYPGAFLAVAEANKAEANKAEANKAEAGEEVAGYVLGFDHPSFFANGRVAWVEEIMVTEAFRRQGIGRDLMEAFEAWANERGVKQIALATRRAANFYEALGYEASAVYFRKRL